MGLTNSSTGRRAAEDLTELKRQREGQRVIALAGNPNVGKSTVFNSLTNLNQHTGNWPGKTVTNAQGFCKSGEREYIMVDIPGAYSLMAHSAEEEVARDFICFGGADAVMVVCDATCLERNMNLALQTIEISRRVLLCVNLLDEAKRKDIHIDLELLAERLGVPVLGIVAREKGSRAKLLEAMDALMEAPEQVKAFRVRYPAPVENAVERLLPMAEEASQGRLDSRFLCLRLLEGEEPLLDKIDGFLSGGLADHGELLCAAEKERLELAALGIDRDGLEDMLASALVMAGEELCHGAVRFDRETYSLRDRRIDRIVTGRLVGYPLMALLLAVIFYITIAGANVPSDLLMGLLFGLQEKLAALLAWMGAPAWLKGLLADGAFRVLAWVTAVMLPPMAIFFPLFTLLEDSGYLPRIAYNLDRPFHRCKACGKQALTMAMGFGCNAAGVVGCRIIDSKRERLLAVLTNSFVPCNGRFPTLIALLSMFFIGAAAGGLSTVLSALLLTGLIILGVAATFAATKLLSATLLKGEPSSFVLELPPYRRPQLLRVIVRSVMDRTLFVLGRAAAVAAPAGAILWIMANVQVGGGSLISLLAGVLDPLGRFLGMDGVILIAFILGFPANEIVLPIIIMAYTAQGSLTELGELAQIKTLLMENGWTWVTALCVMLFSLMHWPCSTTLLTIQKETGSFKWTALAALLPAAAGVALCAAVNALAKLFGL